MLNKLKKNPARVREERERERLIERVHIPSRSRTAVTAAGPRSKPSVNFTALPEALMSTRSEGIRRSALVEPGLLHQG